MNTSQTKRTRQGVPDLNTQGYNGRASSCPCHKNPQTPTTVEMALRSVAVQTPTGIVMKERLVGVHTCTFCGRERFSEHDEEA